MNRLSFKLVGGIIGLSRAPFPSVMIFPNPTLEARLFHNTRPICHTMNSAEFLFHWCVSPIPYTLACTRHNSWTACHRTLRVVCRRLSWEASLDLFIGVLALPPCLSHSNEGSSAGSLLHQFSHMISRTFLWPWWTICFWEKINSFVKHLEVYSNVIIKRSVKFLAASVHRFTIIGFVYWSTKLCQPYSNSNFLSLGGDAVVVID